ncbi:MAG: TadE/TadG family type IV pilus assembly protein, partial [Raoultibacter sp.]
MIDARLRETGQMTVEFAVVFPVLIIVAVIAVNALLFFSECAAFDRVARDAMRVYAASPEYGQTPDQACARVRAVLDD